MTDLSKFYAPLAMLVPVWSFLPLYEKTQYNHYGSLWDMAGEGEGTFGILGLVTATLLTILLVVAAKGDVRAPVPPIIAVLSMLMVLAMLEKPGGHATPDMADSGRAAVAMLAVAIVVAVRHIVALISAARLESVDDKS